MARSKGCTIALIIAGILVVIAIAVLILVYIYRDELMQAGADTMINLAEKELKINIPEGYSEESISALMAEFRSKVHEGSIPREKLQLIIVNFQGAIEDRNIAPEEGAQLLSLIEEALGKEPPDLEGPAEEIPDTGAAVPDSV